MEGRRKHTFGRSGDRLCSDDGMMRKSDRESSVEVQDRWRIWGAGWTKTYTTFGPWRCFEGRRGPKQKRSTGSKGSDLRMTASLQVEQEQEEEPRHRCTLRENPRLLIRFIWSLNWTLGATGPRLIGATSLVLTLEFWGLRGGLGVLLFWSLGGFRVFWGY